MEADITAEREGKREISWGTMTPLRAIYKCKTEVAAELALCPDPEDSEVSDACMKAGTMTNQ